MVMAEFFDFDDGEKNCGRKKCHGCDGGGRGTSLRRPVILGLVDQTVTPRAYRTFIRVERRDMMNEATAVAGFEHAYTLRLEP